MYVGVTLILAGEGATFGSLILFTYAVLVWLGFHLFVVYYEEPHLRKKFGRKYEEYLKVANRWTPNIGMNKR